MSADPAYLNRADRDGECTMVEIVNIAIQTVLTLLFQPEFVNRLDRLIYFETFTHGDMITISDVMFQLFKIRLMKRYSTAVNCNFSLVKEVAYENADVALGPRPVRRAFMKLVKDPLSTVVLMKGNLPLLPYNVYRMSGFGITLEFKASKENDKVMKELELIKRLKGRAAPSGEGASFPSSRY